MAVIWWCSDAWFQEDQSNKKLASFTKNFSGNELEALVWAAQSTAMNRHREISMANDVKPAFGTASETLEGFLSRGIINWGTPVSSILEDVIHATSTHPPKTLARSQSSSRIHRTPEKPLWPPKLLSCSICHSTVHPTTWSALTEAAKYLQIRSSPFWRRRYTIISMRFIVTLSPR